MRQGTQYCSKGCAKAAERGRRVADKASRLGQCPPDERGSPFTRDGVAKLVARAGIEPGFDYAVHAHMLRHASGYKLANEGTDTRTIQAYLGHRSIQHTVRYTALAPDRFKSLWRD